MNSPDVARHRRSLWLRSERAFGLESVEKTEQIPSPAEVAPMPNKAQNVSPSQLFTPVEQPDFTMVKGAVLSREEKIAALAKLDERVKPCRLCRLCEARTQTVFGEGDPDAKIFFIGEGPGENEDLQGRPFVGRAGELLNKMIAGMGLRRDQVYIANIVKCRPPLNRQPAPDEVETCTPYLVKQLEIIRPQVIVTLGLPASKYMLDSKLSMGKMRGQWHNWRGIKLMPTFHPAFLLRSYTEENRAMVWSDLKEVMKEVGLPIPSRAR
jgi:uracil-DNA glycosylase family 4